MILVVDVHYFDNTARVAGVEIESWQSSEPTRTFTSEMPVPGDYVPGRFFERELPCILTLLQEHSLTPDVVVVDGYVYLDGEATAGLGRKLYDALEEKVAVVGVAKNRFKELPQKYEVNRGQSKRPLYVTAEGMDVAEAMKKITAMHGDSRMPAMLKHCDRLSKGD